MFVWPSIRHQPKDDRVYTRGGRVDEAVLPGTQIWPRQRLIPQSLILSLLPHSREGINATDTRTFMQGANLAFAWKSEDPNSTEVRQLLHGWPRLLECQDDALYHARL